MEKFFDKIGKVGLLFGCSGIFLQQFVFVVDGGERGLVMDASRGLLPKVYGEGMHLKFPWVQ